MFILLTILGAAFGLLRFRGRPLLQAIWRKRPAIAPAPLAASAAGAR
jgi:hypothetical protein